jgi:hypothetical protein
MFVGDSIHFIDNNLIEHKIHSSEFTSYSYHSKDTLIIDSIPFTISTLPYYPGISLPFLYSTSDSTLRKGTNFSISYDSNYGYGTPYWNANRIKYEDFNNIIHPLQSREISPFATLYIEKNLPMLYFDSIRLEITKYGSQKLNIKSRTGYCFFRLHSPWLEELKNESIDIPPPPPYGYFSLCKWKSDTLFQFVDLSSPLEYDRITPFLLKNPKNAVILIYDESNTIEYVFQPYFRLFHEIYLTRNKYSLHNYNTAFNDLDFEKRMEIKKKYPIRIRLANKKLLDKCD